MNPPRILDDDMSNFLLDAHFGFYQKRFTLQQILTGLDTCRKEYRNYWLDMLIQELPGNEDLPRRWFDNLSNAILEANASQSKKIAKFFQFLTLYKKNTPFDGMKRAMSVICTIKCENEEVLSHYALMLQRIIELCPSDFISYRDDIHKFLFQHLDLMSSSTQDAIASCFSKLPLMCMESELGKMGNEYIKCTMFFLKELIDALLNVDRDNLDTAAMFDTRLPIGNGNWSDYKLLRLIQSLTKCGIRLLMNPHCHLEENILKDYYENYSRKIIEEFFKRIYRKNCLTVPMEILAIVFCNISSFTEAFIRHFNQTYSMIETATSSIDMMNFLEVIDFDSGVRSLFRKSIFGLLEAIYQRCSLPVAIKLLTKLNLLERLCCSLEIVADPKTKFLEVTKYSETTFALKILLQTCKMLDRNTMNRVPRMDKVARCVERAVKKSQISYARSKSFPVPYRRKDCRKLLYECLFALISKFGFSTAKLACLHQAFYSGMKDPDIEVRNLCKESLLKFRHPSLSQEFKKISQPKIVFTYPKDESQDLKILEGQKTLSELPNESFHKADPHIPNLVEVKNGSVFGHNAANSIMNGSSALTPTRIDHNVANAAVDKRNAKMDEVQAIEKEESDEIQLIEYVEGKLQKDQDSEESESENDADEMDEDQEEENEDQDEEDEYQDKKVEDKDKKVEDQDKKVEDQDKKVEDQDEEEEDLDEEEEDLDEEEEDSEEQSDEEAEQSDDMSDSSKKVKFKYVPISDDEK